MKEKVAFHDIAEEIGETEEALHGPRLGGGGATGARTGQLMANFGALDRADFLAQGREIG